MRVSEAGRTVDPAIPQVRELPDADAELFRGDGRGQRAGPPLRAHLADVRPADATPPTPGKGDERQGILKALGDIICEIDSTRA